MKLLDRLERKLGGWAIPNLTLILIFGQIVVYVIGFAEHKEMADTKWIEMIPLIPAKVLAGEYWRLLSFVFEAPFGDPINAMIFWYLFYLMGTVLERTWGTFRYNLFFLVGYLATVGVSFISPEQPASIVFLEGSVFLAFAHLYPGFRVYLMFVWPVAVRWLALLAWGVYALKFLGGDLPQKLQVAAATANFFVFFGRDVLARVGIGYRVMRNQAVLAAKENKPRHRCKTCGITNKTHPDMEFRYCSKCTGSPCYCEEHLRNHEHIVG